MTETIEADVAVIGGGPAGLSAALALRQRGIGRVVILDRETTVGGVPRHCGHPAFGLREFHRLLTGPAYARRLADLAGNAGLDVRVGHSVVALGEHGHLHVTSPKGRLAVTAERVIIATGLRETPRAARLISGDRPLGVLNTGALQAFVYLKGLLPFRRPVVVGTELVSQSAVFTCLRAGIRPVAVVEPNDRPTVRRPFDLFPTLCGIPIHYRAKIAGIVGRERVEGVRLRRADGNQDVLACDGVLFTGQFVPESSLVRGSHLTLDPASGGPAIDQFGRCSDPTYFAAGNVLRAIETAGWSFREGLRIGGLVADDLAGRLPPATRSLRIVIGDDLKYVVPQRLVLPLDGAGLSDLQLRVRHSITGSLTVEVDGIPVWRRRRMTTLPERRLLIPLSRFALPERAETITIHIAGPT
jgi:thioredoxin reductase